MASNNYTLLHKAVKPLKFSQNVSQHHSSFNVFFHTSTFFEQAEEIVLLCDTQTFTQLANNLYKIQKENGIARR